MAKIALIVGSVRQERQGIKVARWVGGSSVSMLITHQRSNVGM